MSLVRTGDARLLVVLVAATIVMLVPTILMSGSLLPIHASVGAWLALLPWLVYIAVGYGATKLYERTWSTREGNVRADERGLYLDGRLVVARRGLRHGNIMKDGDRLFLRLHRRAPFMAPYDIEVETEHDARKLLADLRLDPQTSVSDFELRWGTERAARVGRWVEHAIVATGLVVPLVRFRREPHQQLVGLLWIAAIAAVLYFVISRTTEVSVGADGVRLRRIFRSERFVAFSALHEVRLVGKNLHLDLIDGTSISLHRDAEAAVLEQRIREALAVHRERNVNAAATVNRGGRTTAEWLAVTKERGATYRNAVVPDDELWNIVEDAAASPTERAGAALALRTELDDAGRTRLRIAAGACAEKKLRVALESVATHADDDEELAGALEPLEDRRHFSTKSMRTTS